jgi:hypothetical protein
MCCQRATGAAWCFSRRVSAGTADRLRWGGDAGTPRLEPSRSTTACGATSSASRLSARLARTSWVIPMPVFATRIPRNRASRQSPNTSVTTPKLARIRLKIVRTLARMMLAHERLAEIVAAPPRWLRRRCASALVRPWTAAVGRRETAPDRSEMLAPSTAELRWSAGFTTEAAIPRPVLPLPPAARVGAPRRPCRGETGDSDRSSGGRRRRRGRPTGSCRARSRRLASGSGR